MKFTPATIQLLKNFAAINPSIIFKEGDTLGTLSQSKSVLAKAKLDTTIVKQFAIYDLSRFLSTLALFSDPVIEINDTNMTIKQGSRKISYVFADPSLIISPPEKDLKMPDPEIKFTLNETDFADLMKAQSVLSLPEISICGDGENITIGCVDSKKGGDSYSTAVGKTTDTFRMLILAENIRILPGTYEVEVTSKGLSKFTGAQAEYWIAVESNSTFG
jgi:hypothetical protein